MFPEYVRQGGAGWIEKDRSLSIPLGAGSISLSACGHLSAGQAGAQAGVSRGTPRKAPV